MPGFAAQNEAGSDAAAAPAPPTDPLALSTRAGTRQLNLRIALGLHERYRRLLRDCEDAGIETSMTELVQALLHEGPHGVDDTRRLIRAWRDARDFAP